MGRQRMLEGVGSMPFVICGCQVYSCRVSLLLTPHRLDGIRALNGLPAKGLSREGGEGIPAYNTRILSLEVEDHISVPVSIDILQGRLHRRSLSTVWTKADCSLVYSGGIKGIRSQDGHWDHPFGSGVDAVREGARLDVDGDGGNFALTCAASIENRAYFRVGQGTVVYRDLIDRSLKLPGIADYCRDGFP